MTERYRIRRDRKAWSVFDVWTNQVVSIEGALKQGLDEKTAADLARRLNERDVPDILQ